MINFKGEKVRCPKCGFPCAIKNEEGKVICFSNTGCNYIHTEPNKIKNKRKIIYGEMGQKIS